MAKKIKALAFDLDYTLYNMDDYLYPVFMHIAKRVGEVNCLDHEELHKQLIACANTNGLLHENLFDIWLEEANIYTSDNIKLAISSFHQLNGLNISLYYDAVEMLKYCKNRYKIGLLTDGNKRTQLKKIEALGLSVYLDVAIFSDDLGTSKPDVVCFEQLKEKLAVNYEEILFIGDHPIKDIYGSKSLGISSVRILKGAYMNMPDVESYGPDHTVKELSELINLL